MESMRFDQLSRLMGRATTRRGALKTMTAGTVGTVGGAALVTAASAHAQAAVGEEWVQLYEAMAAAVDTIDGPCSNVTEALRTFQAQNTDRLQRMQDDIATWTPEQVAAHQQAYGPRVQQAAIAIHLAMTRCGYVEGSDSPFSLADVNADFTPATPEATPGATMMFGTAKSIGGPDLVAGGCGFGGCDCVPHDPDTQAECLCDNAFTTGNCIAFGFACAFGGCASPPNCCYSGICIGGFDHNLCLVQAKNCLNIQVNC